MRTIPIVVVAVMLVAASVPGVARAQKGGATRANPTATAQAEFEKRVNDYVALHKRLEAMLPKLSKEATPQEIDKDQRALGDLIAQARANAKPGDLFTPDMQRVVHQLMNQVFKGKAGREVRRYIHDEPHPVTPDINKRYPDAIPLSTMPLRVLAQLPKLPEELEYRFVANHLILMDVHSHLILDYVLNAIPPA